MNEYKCAMCGQVKKSESEVSKDSILICQECFKTLRMRKVPKNTEVIGEEDSHVSCADM